MFLQSVNTAAMEKALSALWQRQQVINSNIANQDTPGYKAKRLAFEDLLKSELDSVNNNKNSKMLAKSDALDRINSVTPVVYRQLDTITRADENNVDILAEQIALTKAQYHYQALAQKIGGYYTTLQLAITGR